MGRILGIDFGVKRIGLAVTDPLKIFASPLETVAFREFDRFIKDYQANDEIEAFVIGYPVQMNNLPSDSVKQLDPFIGKLRKKYPLIQIYLVDERFTSQMAMKTMIDGGVKKMKRRDKALVDKISASIILQGWLDGRPKTGDGRREKKPVKSPFEGGQGDVSSSVTPPGPPSRGEEKL